MSYIDGFVIPVPTDGKEAYLASASLAAALFKEFGATRIVECWGDDVPAGKVTDFRRAVQATADETVVFSWVLWPSKEARMEGNKKMEADPRMKEIGMSFDGKRLIYGSFEAIVDAAAPDAATGAMRYVEGFVVAVPTANQEAYRAMAAKAAPSFHGYGALRLVECWGEDVPRGKVTDFRGAVKATDDETVVFSWLAWPSKEVRAAGKQKMLDDPEMKMPDDAPFDGQRMIYGGFSVVLDTASASGA